MTDNTVRSEQDIENERYALKRRIERTMSKISVIRDEHAKSEALATCRKAFMVMSANPMEKFGMPADFSNAYTLLDWADLVIMTYM